MHFTYEDKADLTSLYQGDVISRTAEVDTMLREVHPHYHKKADDYHYLLVLTQACDLVRRPAGSPCGARYISLAAVRPFDLVLRREIAKYQYHPKARAGGFCDIASRAKVHDFLERLFNNNEHEYFYLNEEAAIGLQEPHCGFLALSIAVKAELHYDTLLAAKIGQLKETFQHKLGWLVGHLYSRVGTDDWVPTACSLEDFEKRIHKALDDHAAWIPPEHQKALLKRLKDVAEVTPKVVEPHLAEVRRTIPKKKDVVVTAVASILAGLDVDGAVIDKAKKRIESDPGIANIIFGDL